MKYLPILALACALTGCASYGALEPTGRLGNEVIFVDGGSMSISRKANTAAIAGSARQSFDVSERLLFEVEIANFGPEPLTVGPENINVRTDAGGALKVYTTAELEKAAKTKAAWAAFGAGLQAAGNNMQASQAGNTSSSGTYSGTARTTSNSYQSYGSSSTTRFSGSYQSNGYDAAAAAQARTAANLQNQYIMERTKQDIEAMRRSAQTSTFDKHTVMPGESYRSLLTVGKMPSRTQVVVVDIDVGEDHHSFEFGFRPEG